MGEIGHSRQMRRRRSSAESSPPPPPRRRPLIFPLLLASYSRIRRRHGRSLLKRILRSHLSLLGRYSASPLPSRSVLPDGLLALLPPLLTTRKYPSVMILAAEVVGAVALSSLETNKMVAMGEGIIDAMVTLLKRGVENEGVMVAACNAILDLSTGPVGRRCLRHSEVLANLLSICCQVATSTLPCLSTIDNEIGDYCEDVMDDKFSAVVLSTALNLINTPSEIYPSNVPKDLANHFLGFLKQFWYKLKFRNPRDRGCNFGIDSDLAEALFRLSLDGAQHSSSSTAEFICRDIFGDVDDFWHFFLDHWEQSPFLFKGSLRNFKENGVIFNSLFNSLNGRTSDAVLDFILRGMVSCPPIASDELDILSYLSEAKSRLGSPPLYGQDIRVVRTLKTLSPDCKECREKEDHFFDTRQLHLNDIRRCKEAFKGGYTIAVRGLSFRSEKVSAITDGLAEIFGLPSAGANIYLTPLGSQGLSRHFDDHCVFVCQLLGSKKWKLSCCQRSVLPRLYEGQCSLAVLHDHGEDLEDISYTLREGDVLYIPRGCPHEAYTGTSEYESLEEIEDSSLHLTLAIEVEPPFEWEGLIHISLHLWSEKQLAIGQQDGSHSSDAALVSLLHIAISSLAGQDSVFRKLCMIAARFAASLMEWHISCQKAIFVELIGKVRAKCRFSEAHVIVEAAVDRCNHEELQWLRWLRHLSHSGDENEEMDFRDPVESFKDVVQLIKMNFDEAEVAYEMVKNKFCDEAVFEDACASFALLLERYRSVRRQYTKGMLSLHPNF